MVLAVHPVGYDDLLVALAGWVLKGCAVWAVLVLAGAAVEAASAGRVRATSWVATPPAVRRALLAALGVLLVGAAPGPVAAARGPLPVPVRPSGAAHPASRVVTVRPGDTLWSLAEAGLPRGTDDAQVLAAVHRWYARNRVAIGPDPDLLLPGERLRPDEETR